MILIKRSRFLDVFSEGCARDSSRKTDSGRKTCAVRLLRGDPLKLIQPLAHGLRKVIAGLAEGGVAPGEIFRLLALEIAHRAAVVDHCLPQQSGVRGIDLAIEVGESR